MEEQAIAIHWTCGSLEEARAVSRELVKKRLVACANIIPWIESVFMWNNELDVSQETKVIFKTTKPLFESTKAFILENAKYEVPEIIAVPIVGANPAYLQWMQESVTAPVN